MTRRNNNKVARTAPRGNSFGRGLESLETRQMFSASPADFYTVALGSSTELVCQLTSPSEQMSVVRSSNGIQFNIEGVVEDVAGSFSYLSVIAKSGNNSVVIGDNMITPTCVWAGTGNDTLSTGASNDCLRAGAGDDTLIALGGNDNKLYAGTGYTNIWETYSATTDNYYYTSTGTLTTHFFSSFLNTSDISLDGSGAIADPGITNTTIPFSGGYDNFAYCPLFSTAGPQLTDINQQHIGDCYFMSALGAISNVDPQQIRNNITALGDGTYAIEFFENGTPTFIRVNADLPVDNNQLFGANFGNGGSIWAPLMEKAFVYFDSIENGKSPDYGVIDKGGFADPAFDILTGDTAQGTYNALNNTENFSMFGDNSNTFAGWINWKLQEGDAVEMAVSKDNGTDYSIPGVLENDHMYTVVSDTFNNSGQIAGFWLRNPWGFDLQSSEDTEVMAKSGHNDGSDDGLVWVSVAQAWSVVDDIGAVAV